MSFPFSLVFVYAASVVVVVVVAVAVAVAVVAATAAAVAHQTVLLNSNPDPPVRGDSKSGSTGSLKVEPTIPAHIDKCSPLTEPNW